MSEIIITETVTMTAVVAYFVQADTKASIVAKAALELFDGDSDKCRKAFIAELKLVKPSFKASETGTPEKRAYDAFRKQLNLLELAGKPAKESKPETGVIDITPEIETAYDAQERLALILAECKEHPELAALLKAALA